MNRCIVSTLLDHLLLARIDPEPRASVQFAWLSNLLDLQKMGIHLEPYDCATLVCSSDANVLRSFKSNQRPDISSSFASSSPSFTNSYANIREDCEAVVEILV